MLEDAFHSPALQTGGIFAILIAMVELVKYLIGKMTSNPQAGFTAKDRAALRDLYIWHKPNPDGIQPWKNWGSEELHRGMREMVELQRKTLDTLRRIERK